MITVKVLFVSGNSITTGINCSFTEACDYYKYYVNVSENDVTGEETYDFMVGIQQIEPQSGEIVYFSYDNLRRDLDKLDGLYAEWQELEHVFPFSSNAAEKEKEFRTAKKAFETKYHQSLRDIRLALMPQEGRDFMKKFMHAG